MPLHAAVARRNAAVVRELLNRGADVNGAQAGGFTPLHSAAFHGDREIVELLLSHGADTGKRTADGKTPAALAAEHGNAAVAETARRYCLMIVPSRLADLAPAAVAASALVSPCRTGYFAAAFSSTSMPQPGASFAYR